MSPVSKFYNKKDILFDNAIACQRLKLLVLGLLKIICQEKGEGWLVGVWDGKNEFPSITDYILMGSHQEFRPIRSFAIVVICKVILLLTCQVQTIEDNTTSYKIDYVAQLSDILNPEEFMNNIIGSKVIATFLYLMNLAFWCRCIGKGLLPTGLPNLVSLLISSDILFCR